MWLKGEIEQYDFGVNFCSIDHSGLGRYTDPLNPYGDLESMAQSWCMMKHVGIFTVNVENSLYGPKKLSQLTANYKVLKKYIQILIRITSYF